MSSTIGKPVWVPMVWLPMICMVWLLALAACDRPSQFDPAVYGEVHVGTGPSLDGIWDFTSDQRQQINDELPLLNALGPSWISSSEGSADVVVRAADLHGSCGAFTRGTRFVEIDTTCTHSPEELQRAVAHELMHWWTSDHGWLGHICQHEGDAPDCHPTIWGDAVLNPSLTPDAGTPGFDELYSPPIADPYPSSNDLLLFAACQHGNCLAR